MKKQFVTYEIALQLNDLNFDEPCFSCYDEKGMFALTIMSLKEFYTNSEEDTWNCTAPLWQQVIDWFRDKGDIEIIVSCSIGGFKYEINTINSDYFPNNNIDGEIIGSMMGGVTITGYNSTREKAIKEAIKLYIDIKKKNK